MNLNQLFRHLSIQWKLIIAFVLLSIVPVCAIGFYEIHSRLKTLEQIAIENVQHDVSNIQEKAQAFLTHVEEDIHYLSHSAAFQGLISQLDAADSPDRRTQRSRVEEQFLNFGRSKSIYHRFKLIDTYGDEVLRIERSAGQPTILPENALENDRSGYYLTVMSHFQPGQVFLTPVEIRDYATGDYVPAISYAIPIFDAQNRWCAILIADIRAESCFQILEGSHASPPGRVFVVSQEGYYLYHLDKKRDWSRLLAARNVENLHQDYARPIVARILSGNAGTIVEDKNTIISYAPLFYGPGAYPNFYVVFRDVPKRVLFASVQRFKQVYVGLVLLVILVALFFGFLAARQFTNPIRQLIEGVTIIGSGNFAHRLYIETNDEIEDLATQFNRMAEAIQQRETENVHLHAQIQQHANQLEEMVEERTRELREAQRQLIQTEKLSAIGRLAAGVAHEINNPMAVISTCVEGLQAQLKETGVLESLSDLPEYLTAIREAAYRCKEITRKLLSFSRQTALTLTPTDVNQVLKETVALVEYEATHAHKPIVLDLQPGLPTIQADADQLSQVFLNLILNALDATSAGDRLEICTCWTLGWKHIVIRFQDTGAGIPTEQLDKIFEPFYTTKGTGKGTQFANLQICRFANCSVSPGADERAQSAWVRGRWCRGWCRGA